MKFREVNKKLLDNVGKNIAITQRAFHPQPKNITGTLTGVEEEAVIVEVEHNGKRQNKRIPYFSALSAINTLKIGKKTLYDVPALPHGTMTTEPLTLSYKD